MDKRTTEYPFTHVCQVRIAGNLHGLDPDSMAIEISGPHMYGIDDFSPVIDRRTGDVTITFLIPQTGVVILKPFNP